MTATSGSTEIVIDANLAVSAVLPPISVSVDIPELLKEWECRGVVLVAPAMWITEAVSAVRKSVYLRLVTPEIADPAIDDLLALGVVSVDLDVGLCRSAYNWASRLNQIRAYDSFFVALAEREGVEMWTGDRRLANAARQAGAPWVRWIGEAQ